ncbi:MAG: ROK family protein [Propionibacteriaceae bacterium]|nr:ROK family protein [Propionibacteriaceae bacterium]
MTHTEVKEPQRRTRRRKPSRAQDQRRSNLALVMSTLYENPGISRADLARLTGVTRVTSGELIKSMIADDYAEELGVIHEQRPGKPSTKLRMPYERHNIIAIDMSGSRSVTGALCTLDGQLLNRVEHELDGKTGQDAVDELIATVRELEAAAEQHVVGVGVGTPGFVGPEPGVVTSTNLEWHALNLKAALEKELGMSVDVENDANSAALAEHRFAEAPDDFIRMQISRGVGSGLLLRGELITGPFGGAGEFGHVVVDPAGGTCSCGKEGCLETWIRVPAMLQRIEESHDRDAVLTQAGQKLGEALSFVLATADIVDVILGGPPELLDGTFLEAAAQTVRERTRIEARPEASIKLSTLDEDAVLLGAAAIVMKNQLGVS